MPSCKTEANQSTVESCDKIALDAFTQTKKETATKINATGAKVEQRCLLNEVEMNKARMVITDLSKEFDGIVKMSQITGAYTLAKNEFVFKYPNTNYEVKQAMVVAYNPKDQTFEIRNGNIAGTSLFTSVGYKKLLNRQVACLQSEQTGCRNASNMEGINCIERDITIHIPQPCPQIQEVINNYNVLMMLPGMDRNECCFSNCITPHNQPAPNVVRYENGCYRGHMVCDNKRIDYNFPEQEFKPFLDSCGGNLNLSALTANQFAICTDIPAPVHSLRGRYPQYVSQAPNCGLDLTANQYALCNTYEPLQYNPQTHEHDCIGFRNDVFPIAQYHQETDTHQVVIGGEVSHFREPELVSFLEAYNDDYQAELTAECLVDTNGRYRERYVDKKYENRAVKSFLKAERLKERADTDYQHTADKQNVKLQSLIDSYDNLLKSCENPDSKKVQRAQRDIEQYQKKMSRRAERENRQYERRMQRVEKYRAKSCGIATKGIDDLQADRVKNQADFEKDRDKKLGLKSKKSKRKKDTNET